MDKKRELLGAIHAYIGCLREVDRLLGERESLKEALAEVDSKIDHAGKEATKLHTGVEFALGELEAAGGDAELVAAGREALKKVEVLIGTGY